MNAEITLFLFQNEIFILHFSYEDVMKELRGEAPTSAFEESPSAPRLGPSLAKQPKLEISKSSSSLRSGRHKNVLLFHY